MMLMKHYLPNPLLARRVHKFSMPKFTKGNSLNKNIFSKFSPGYLLIIFYQLTLFEVPSYNNSEVS